MSSRHRPHQLPYLLYTVYCSTVVLYCTELYYAWHATESESHKQQDEQSTTLLVVIAEYYNVVTVGKMGKRLGYLFVKYRIMYSTQTRFLDDVYPTVCCSASTPF